MDRHRRPLTIAYIDVDNFKLINDRYGHPVGDEFLRVLGHEMAARLLRARFIDVRVLE